MTFWWRIVHKRPKGRVWREGEAGKATPCVAFMENLVNGKVTSMRISTAPKATLSSFALLLKGFLCFCHSCMALLYRTLRYCMIKASSNFLKKIYGAVKRHMTHYFTLQNFALFHVDGYFKAVQTSLKQSSTVVKRFAFFSTSQKALDEFTFGGFVYIISPSWEFVSATLCGFALRSTQRDPFPSIMIMSRLRLNTD